MNEEDTDIAERLHFLENKSQTDFQHYQFLEMGSILSLNGVWKILQERLTQKISKIKEIGNLDFDSINLLQSGIDNFNGLIRDVNSRADEPRRKTIPIDSTFETSRNDQEVFMEYVDDYFEWQHKKIDLVLGKLPGVFDNVLTAFMLHVNFPQKHVSKPTTVKFKVYNLVLRFPENNDYDNSSAIIDGVMECDFDRGLELLNDRSNYYRQHLMQGFDGVEFMIQRLRNFSVHKHDKDGRKILRDLKREIEDPITDAESVGNIITLCSALTLCAYQFDEIIQTWIDTDTFIQGKT